MGELSAVNAIAGAYAERAPVVHIVGSPSRSLQEKRALVHHTFNDGDYHNFDRIHEHVTVAQAILSDARTSPAEIDYVLTQCLLRRRPVRIALPTDMVAVQVPSARLSIEIPIPFTALEQPAERNVLARIIDRIYRAKQPAIIIDGESEMLGISGEIQHLVQLTKWPTFTTEFGKGLVNETWANSYGIYLPEHKPFVDSCDLVLCFGKHYSTTNTFAYITIPKPETAIIVEATCVQVAGETFRDIPAKNFVSRLVKEIDRSKLEKKLPVTVPVVAPTVVPSVLDSEPVTQVGGFWQKINPMLRPGDLVLGETGTSAFGVKEFTLPPETRIFTPVTWLSIGYMLPAALGVSVAQRDMQGDTGRPSGSTPRTILFIGDGSFQMTVQEISTMIHEKLNTIIFVINNDGYTVERYVHGPKQRYNNVAPWRYLTAPQLFGADETGEFAARTWTIRTWGDLDRVLKDDNLLSGKGLRMVEVFMERMDAPPSLFSLLDQLSKR